MKVCLLLINTWKLHSQLQKIILTRAGPIYGTGSCCELDQTLKRFWQIESCGTDLNVPIVCTEEEKVALEKVSSSVRYNRDLYHQVFHGKPQTGNCSLRLGVCSFRLPGFRILARRSTCFLPPCCFSSGRSASLLSPKKQK